MKTEEYKLLDGRIIRAKIDRLGMCKISQENLESFVQEFNASYRQAKILEKIKENYALMKLDERNTGKWIKEYDNSALDGLYHCSVCGRRLWISKEESVSDYPYCHCGASMNHASEDTTKYDCQTACMMYSYVMNAKTDQDTRGVNDRC